MDMHTDPARFLVDSGLLFELNRRVLHPQGLALVVEVDDAGAHQIKGLWQVEDREGIIFAPEALADGQAKLDAYMVREGNLRDVRRKLALGFVEQPLDVTPVAIAMPAPTGARSKVPPAVMVGALFFVLALAAAGVRWWLE